MRERVATARPVEDPGRRNGLRARDSPPEPQHEVGERSPTHTEPREGSPPPLCRGVCRPVASQCDARVIPAGVFVIGLTKEGQKLPLRVSAADVRRARIARRAQRAPQIRTASFLEVALAPIRLVPEQCAHMVLARGPGIRQRVAPGPVRGPSVALRSSVDGNGLRILGCGGRVAPESSARSVDPELGLECEATTGVQNRKRITEAAVRGRDVVLPEVGDLERVAHVAQTGGLARGEIAPDIIDGDDRLLQHVLADDVVFAEGVVVEPAVPTLARYGDVLSHVQAPLGERRVDAPAPPLQPVIRRGSRLIEVIEGSVVGVVSPGPRYRKIRVGVVTGTEYRVPPVGAGAPRHDQVIGIRVRGGIHVVAWRRPAIVRPDVGGHRWVVPERVIPVDVRRDCEPGIPIGGLHDPEVVERVEDQEVIIATHRSGNAGSHVQRSAARTWPTALRFDDDDAVTAARTVDGRC